MKGFILCCMGAALATPGIAGVVYTCDANLTSASPNACTVLNTTIAGLYNSTFTNASANIYVKLGNTALGYSFASFYYFSYTDYRNALIAAQSSSSDATALANSVPPENPFGNQMVELPNALLRALGMYNPTGGIDINLGSCNRLGALNCYDGVIVISSSQPLYFRNGAIKGSQYDFYSVVEHETDEILGTGSCAFGCNSTVFEAPDLFRYHSNGTRAASAGTNASCATSSATNACFSLDGTHMLQQYNAINNGEDAGDWMTSCISQLVQDAERCSGTGGVDISQSAEILVLDAIGYTLQPFVQHGSFTCTNTTAPTIASVESASAYGGYPYYASGSWLEIKGTNLADPADPRLTAAVNPGQWTINDFTNTGNAPTVLDGISVDINGKPAYVWYLSPTQINVQAPEDSATGGLAISVTNCHGQSDWATLARQALAPGFLAPPNYAANGTQYMVATFVSDPTTYVLNTATGGSFGLLSRPAKPGEQIIAYGVGFGDVSPPIPPGVIVQQSNTLNNPVTISFGNTRADVTYQGLAGNFVGLYEFYITVPTGLANGDYRINVTQNGSPLAQPPMYLTVHN